MRNWTRWIWMLFMGMAMVGKPGWSADRPNILWITSEDNGPHLGCYGDAYATTPHLDGLAAKGTVYTKCWSTAPVCAPARTTIISGVYPPALGAEHMRSLVSMPSFMRMYPQILREAGYYCTNNRKEDYNLDKPGTVWDDSSGQAHWKNRREGQPFFAIFNHTVSHESQIRSRPHRAVHDPAEVRVPAYHPDRPEVRQDWAQYYDKLTEMDELVGDNLRELEEAGLAGDTIVFYYGDHGPGMPRGKRWPYNSGLHVPLIVFVPEKFKSLASADYEAGGRSDRLVGFIDLAPTLLSLAGVRPPDWMQGHAFMGPFEEEPQAYQFGFRGRMDERYDLVRAVRDQRYVYLRHYMPHKIYGQHIDYMFQTPTTRIWKDLYDGGDLKPPQTFFWESKPVEELYDLENDPDEVRNLAKSAEHQEVLRRLRRAHQAWEEDIRDVGFLPEAEMHARAEAAGVTPYELGRDAALYPFGTIFAAAQLASDLDADEARAIRDLRRMLEAEDSAVRYWGAMGLLMRGEAAVGAQRERLKLALGDDSVSVRVAAAEALGMHGTEADKGRALEVLLAAANVREEGLYAALAGLNALDAVDWGNRQASVREALRELPREDPGLPGKLSNYVPRLLEELIEEGQEESTKR